MFNGPCDPVSRLVCLLNTPTLNNMQSYAGNGSGETFAMFMTYNLQFNVRHRRVLPAGTLPTPNLPATSLMNPSVYDPGASLVFIVLVMSVLVIQSSQGPASASSTI